MNEGKLCCSGSPFFLKKAFGTGYQLRVQKSPMFNSKQFESVLRHFIPTASLQSEIEAEVIYSLNDKAKSDDARNGTQSLVSTFPRLFREIEANKSQYGINSCGLSYSTLED